jgi:hypothetical protein
MKYAEKETSAITSKLAKFERDDVQLQERKKHLTTKQKKINATLTTVSIFQHNFN